MKIAISQPTFNPWVGYFDIIDQCDHFVYLDHVQFQPRSWMQRNKIQTSTGLQWLTIPVRGSDRHRQNLNEVEIAQDLFPDKQIRTLEMNYKRAPYFTKYYEKICQLMALPNGPLLSDFCVDLIDFICDEIGIKTPRSRSSKMELQGKRSELLANICRTMSANQYLSTAGASDYLTEEAAIFESSQIEVFIHQYRHPHYRQVYSPFQEFAGALDLLLNHGPDSLELIRSGRKPSIPIQNYEKKLDVLFIGDSIVEAKDQPNGQRWVELVAKKLELQASCSSIGITGATTKIALEEMKKKDLVHPDVVTLQFGINDSIYWQSLQGKPRTELSEFRHNLAEIIKLWVEKSASKIVLVTNHSLQAPRVEINGSTHGQNLLPYNQIIREVAQEYFCGLVDIEKLEKEGKTPLTAADGVHLSPEGHELYSMWISQYLAAEIKNMVEAC